MDKRTARFLQRVARLKAWLAQFPRDERNKEVWAIIALIEHPDDFKQLAAEEAATKERLGERLGQHLWDLESAPRRLREEVDRMKRHFPAEKYPHAGEIPEV